MLELDHVLSFVEPGGDWAERLERAGWTLDAGTTHPGQGTRNRRCRWGAGYLELVWVHDLAEASAHRLRLDRRARWHQSGASPFGFVFRGRFPEPIASECWTYAPDPAFRFSVHRHCEERPEQPLLVCMQLDDDACHARGAMIAGHAGPARTLTRAVLATAHPTPPGWAGLPLLLRTVTAAAPHLTLVFGEGAGTTEVTDQLRIEA